MNRISGVVIAAILALGAMGSYAQTAHPSQTSPAPTPTNPPPYVPPSEPLDPSLNEWRYPQESDIKDDWDEYRIMFPEPFHVKGDFDGNGVVDDVWILLKKQSKGWGVFVFMRGPAGKKLRIMKIHSSNEEGADEHGLVYYPPQVLEAACAKGIKGCKEGQMGTLELKRPAFLFFEFEAETKLYSWNATTKSFEMILRQAFGMPYPAIGNKSGAPDGKRMP